MLLMPIFHSRCSVQCVFHRNWGAGLRNILHGIALEQNASPAIIILVTRKFWEPLTMFKHLAWVFPAANKDSKTHLRISTRRGWFSGLRTHIAGSYSISLSAISPSPSLQGCFHPFIPQSVLGGDRMSQMHPKMTPNK